MKSIREAVMSKDEAETPKYPSDSLFNSDRNYETEYGGYYNGNQGTNYYQNNYKSKKTGDTTISIIVENKEIGEIADITNDRFNEAKAEAKAIEIAYDHIEKLLGKGFESKYALSFEATDGYDEWEVETTLTPVK